MTPAERLERWTAMIDEASALAVDFRASLIIDADHAAPRLDMRLSALRGQVRAIDVTKLPYPAWEDAREFAWLAQGLVDESQTIGDRARHAEGLAFSAARLKAVLATTSAGRRRADLDD